MAVTSNALRAEIAGAALAVLAGGGCSSISLSPTEARAPILLGPVACMGCAPEPARAPSTPAVAGGVRNRQYIFPMFGSYADKVARETPPLDVAAADGLSDPCRQDLHVDGIHAGTWGFDVPILFAIEDVWIEVQASPAAVPNGTCGRAPEGNRP